MPWRRAPPPVRPRREHSWSILPELRPPSYAPCAPGEAAATLAEEPRAKEQPHGAPGRRGDRRAPPPRAFAGLSGRPRDGAVMLVVSGGLPGTGKMTVARAVAARCRATLIRATLIRVDAIEQAMRSAGVLEPGGVGPAGYMAARAPAEANLRLGLP